MLFSSKLPDEYYERLRALEASYLSHDDPLRQSGFNGGPVKWKSQRRIVLDAIEDDGTFLDVGAPTAIYWNAWWSGHQNAGYV